MPDRTTDLNMHCCKRMRNGRAISGRRNNASCHPGLRLRERFMRTWRRQPPLGIGNDVREPT